MREQNCIKTILHQGSILQESKNKKKKYKTKQKKKTKKKFNKKKNYWQMVRVRGNSDSKNENRKITN